MSPILTPALGALRHGFDVASPNRDRTTDGWIGDAAHQVEVSGHNPDDTPGVRAEYSDADTIPEVRAIDVDTDLRATFTMQDCIDKILDTPTDLARLSYIIFNRREWTRRNGWDKAGVLYLGSDPHTNHAHFSGEPLSDNDSRPWSVEQMADYTEAEMKAFPWQYTGRGIGENNGTTVQKSMLAYFDEVLQLVRDINAALIDVKSELDIVKAQLDNSTQTLTAQQIAAATATEIQQRLTN